MTLKQFSIDSPDIFEAMYSCWKQWKIVYPHFLRKISSSWGNSKSFFWGTKMRSELHFSKTQKFSFSDFIATHTYRNTLKQLFYYFQQLYIVSKRSGESIASWFRVIRYMWVAIISEKDNLYVFWKMKLRPHFGASKKAFWVSPWRWNFPQKNVGKHFFITFNNYTLLEKDQGNLL